MLQKLSLLYISACLWWTNFPLFFHHLSCGHVVILMVISLSRPLLHLIILIPFPRPNSSHCFPSFSLDDRNLAYQCFLYTYTTHVWVHYVPTISMLISIHFTPLSQQTITHSLTGWTIMVIFVLSHNLVLETGNPVILYSFFLLKVPSNQRIAGVVDSIPQCMKFRGRAPYFQQSYDFIIAFNSSLFNVNVSCVSLWPWFPISEGNKQTVEAGHILL